MNFEHRTRNSELPSVGWRCPKCGVVRDTEEDLKAHFEAHPVCGDFARNAAYMARHYGVHVCVRCEAAIMGVASMTKANGFVHEGCLTDEEHAELEAESRQILSEIENANTDPRLIGMPELGRKRTAKHAKGAKVEVGA